MKHAKCPICENRVEEAKFKPFCSKRCADIDLGRWLKGSYAIPGSSSDQAEETPTKSRDFED